MVSAVHNPVVDQLVSALEQVTVSRYLCGAALTVSVYDWVLLFSDEYMTIWKTRWSLPKAIYYFNRIVTPIGLSIATFQLTDLKTTFLSSRFCTLYVFTNSLTELLSFFLSNWLLTLRVLALYKHKRWVCWFLYTFLILSYAVTAFLMVWTLHIYGTTIQYSPILHLCGSTTRSELMPLVFIVPFAFEFTLFVLLAWRAWRDSNLISTSSNTPFLTTLYRDGMICFFIMFGVRIWNIWIYATQPLTSAYMGIYLLWAVMTILSTRVYLNLVYLAHNPTLSSYSNRNNNNDPTEVSRARFASPARLAGIKMRVQTTTTTMTFGDEGEEVVTFGRGTELRTFDSMAGMENVVHAEPLPAWGEQRQQKSEEGEGEGEGKAGEVHAFKPLPPLPPPESPSRRPLSHQPFSSDSSFVQHTPTTLLNADKQV